MMIQANEAGGSPSSPALLPKGEGSLYAKKMLAGEKHSSEHLFRIIFKSRILAQEVIPY
jgi:hypothetical protein